MTEPIGGDQVIRLDQLGQHSDESQGQQQDCGEDGDSSLHQAPVGGLAGLNSNWGKDGCYQRLQRSVRIVRSVRSVTAKADAEDDADAEQNRDEHKVAQKGSREG